MESVWRTVESILEAKLEIGDSDPLFDSEKRVLKRYAELEIDDVIGNLNKTLTVTVTMDSFMTEYDLI
jgi:hypothetical protein